MGGSGLGEARPHEGGGEVASEENTVMGDRGLRPSELVRAEVAVVAVVPVAVAGIGVAAGARFWSSTWSGWREDEEEAGGLGMALAVVVGSCFSYGGGASPSSLRPSSGRTARLRVPRAPLPLPLPKYHGLPPAAVRAHRPPEDAAAVPGVGAPRTQASSMSRSLKPRERGGLCGLLGDGREAASRLRWRRRRACKHTAKPAMMTTMPTGIRTQTQGLLFETLLSLLPKEGPFEELKPGGPPPPLKGLLDILVGPRTSYPRVLGAWVWRVGDNSLSGVEPKWGFVTAGQRVSASLRRESMGRRIINEGRRSTTSVASFCVDYLCKKG
ncbi:hypothetical protein B0H67DRAFT_195346 [Lasiosphaeris hirsuta]|uniref:Uncharacterized protein n=1 Tax=Lasiosphaeris hirsuta TaxID=260670 RepID=A0AA40E199_9PEZI|nr:hypothetical protein B0H67DRAFT_195346 [Lasiosphaeris hirsuta]